MNPSPELNSILKQLRLSGILDSLEQRNREAIDGQLAYTEFLAMLLHDEVARRENRKLAIRLSRAGFAIGKTLESFDFDQLPALNQPRLRLRSGGWPLPRREGLDPDRRADGHGQEPSGAGAGPLRRPPGPGRAVHLADRAVQAAERRARDWHLRTSVPAVRQGAAADRRRLRAQAPVRRLRFFWTQIWGKTRDPNWSG